MRKILFRFVPALSLVLMLAATAPAANEAQIKAGVQAAIHYLKTQSWSMPIAGGADSYAEGPMALAGIAMIEAGVPTDDPVIVNIAKIVREQATKQARTYQLALDIIFLDKLGEQIDTTLIQSMGVRLLGGQSAQGGWSYSCPAPDENEEGRLKKALGGASMKGSKGEMVGLDPSKRADLDPNLVNILRNRRRQSGGENLGDDNSNTQFALLGLWAARRHGVPVSEALELLNVRMRQLQNPDGGWGYTTGGVKMSSAPMACAGLLALAVAGGNRAEHSMKGSTKLIGDDNKIKNNPAAKKEVPNMLADRQVQAGLAYLGAVMNQTASGGTGGSTQILGPMGPAGRPGPLQGAGGIREDLYFMWSMERVSVVFGIDKIGGRDWYQWGLEVVLKSQSSNGSWITGKYGPSHGNADTSFGLMFLCKSNIVRDLSRILKGKMGEPGGIKPSDPKPPVVGGPVVKGPPETPVDMTDPVAMAKALATASGADYAKMLQQYTEGKGAAFTDALAKAIPQLTGDSQKTVRNALAERMSSFPAATIQKRLHDKDPEVRRAAAIAVCMSDDPEVMKFIPDLIDTINDTEEIVVRGTRTSLREISKAKKDAQDFGPAPGASAADKSKAITEWKAWWSRMKK